MLFEFQFGFRDQQGLINKDFVDADYFIILYIYII